MVDPSYRTLHYRALLGSYQTHSDGFKNFRKYYRTGFKNFRKYSELLSRSSRAVPYSSLRTWTGLRIGSLPGQDMEIWTGLTGNRIILLVLPILAGRVTKNCQKFVNFFENLSI